MYVKHLKQLYNDMQAHFSDLPQMKVQHWFVDPFVANLYDADITQQENFVELQNDTTAEARYKH